MLDKTKKSTLSTTAQAAASSNKLPEERKVIIKPPRFERASATMVGTAPYIQNAFSSANREKMELAQHAGSSQAKTRKAKPPKDFDSVYLGSLHISEEGWYGIPCTAIRNAMIDACRLTEFDMVRAKMCIRIIEDGLDRASVEPLIKIDGKPEMKIDRVKVGMNQTDLAARGLFKTWSAKVTIEWDADVFQAQDVFNLLARAGWQVGIGAGRPLSKMSGGTGKGTWRVET